MIPFIDNIGYNGPLPNFSRDNMTWENMKTVTEKILDRGHMVYCTTDELGWLVDTALQRENADQEVETLEDLQNLRGLEIEATVWVVEEECGFVWNVVNERKGHYIFLGMASNIPQWAKIINSDGSIAGEIDVAPIPDEFIDELDDELPPTNEEPEVTSEEGENN